jgi:hypothetical protein
MVAGPDEAAIKSTELRGGEIRGAGEATVKSILSTAMGTLKKSQKA